MKPDVTKHVLDAVEGQPEISAVYVFGSVARGTEGPGSDVDVAVLFRSTPSATLMGPRLTLEGDLERRIGRAVDLITLNTASADLVHRVLRDGRLVLDRDPSRRIRFEVDKRNEYFDLQPVRDAYRRTGRDRTATP